MQNLPLISIIMPVYKVEKYILASVNSVIQQTYKNIEFILVDDGSPDKSIEVAEQLLNEKGFSYRLMHQENRGLGEARNTGLHMANGEWVLFLDSDDLLVPYAIECLVGAIHRDVDIVFSNYREITTLEHFRFANPGVKQQKLSAEQLQKLFLLRKTVVLAPGSLYRKKFLTENKLLFSEIPWSEDQHFIWRVLRQIRNATYVHEDLYLYMRREGSIMNATRVDAMIKSYTAICELENLYAQGSIVAKFLVPRWVMGTLNSATTVACWAEWEKLYHEMDGRKVFLKLICFPEMKVRMIALMGFLLPRIYYWALKDKKGR